MPRVAYCAVYGCLNTAQSRPDLAFFKLPADERHLQWLRLICREDLIDRPPKNHTVCEEHFVPVDILPGTRRKKLRRGTLPSRLLPDINNLDEGPTTKASTAMEVCTQTEEHTFSADVSTQTAECLSSNTPRKIKVEGIENKTAKFKIDIFHKLCDRFLTKELAELVKAQTHLKFNHRENRYHQSYKMFCLNLYYNSPRAYRVLQSAMCLPSPKTLNKHGIPVTSEINDRLMSILKIKVDTMTDKEKNCSVVIDAMSLKANLFYNITQDKIIGFHEIDGVQSPEPAKNALVVMVCGIFINWKQPVGFALLSECRNYDEIAKWIDKLLKKLFEIGLNIRTFVSNMGSDLFNAEEKRSVTIERPYFFVNEKKIYNIFDVPHLIKLVRDNLISYDFHYQDHVAKYEHIVKFYENDKQKRFKLAHKLTNSHVHPTNVEKTKVHYATQLLSNSVATGVSNSVDSNIIEESGRDTAELVYIMNNLFDTLNSSNPRDNNEYRRPFCGEQSQITFLNEMLFFFQHLKLINPKNGKDVTSTVKFIHGFQVTITSILQLFEDLKSEGCTGLLTRRLNQDELEIFFGQIRSTNDLAAEPTSRQFMSAFQKIFLSNIIKPAKASNCEDDLGKLLIQTSALREQNDEPVANVKRHNPPFGLRRSRVKIEIPDTNDEETYNNVKIISSVYNELDFPETNSLFYVCCYLLKKCAERHNDCQILKSYINPNQTADNFSYGDYVKDTHQNLLVVPPDDFVKYVEKMEEMFRCCFQRERINCKIALLIYKDIKEIYFTLPCPCFPIIYLRKLFIRMRIYYTIKFNNKAFRTCCSRRKHFSLSYV